LLSNPKDNGKPSDMRARVIKGKRNKAIVGKILYFLFYSLTLQPDPFITLSLYLTVSSDIADIRGGGSNYK